MARKIVTVDEMLRLPIEVENALKSDLDATFNGYVLQATNAASQALSAAGQAVDANNNIQNTINQWNTDTNDMSVAGLISNPTSQTYAALQDALSGQRVIPVVYTGSSWPTPPAKDNPEDVYLYVDTTASGTAGTPPTMGASDFLVKVSTSNDGQWSSYTPGFMSSGASMGTGSSRVARWVRNGNTVTGWMHLTFGTGVGGSGTWEFSLPVPPRVTDNPPSGSVWLYDTSSGTMSTGICGINTNGNIIFRPGQGGTTVTATTPWAWASGDSIRAQFTYEVA